jgi:5-(carboxyamino)imidazole ribonucleotide synthase
LRFALLRLLSRGTHGRVSTKWVASKSIAAKDDNGVAKKIGILGSGQLSQMMIQASRRLDVSLRVLASSPNDPAAQEKDIELVVGKVSDPQILHQFLFGLDVVGFESELVDISLLKSALLGHADLAGTRFIPGLPVMELLSEKLEQKKLLVKLGIPSSPFEVAPSENFEPWLLSLRKRWGAFVLKWSKFGYDGRGVIVVEEVMNLSDAEEALAAAHSKKTAVYAEPKVRFVRELALVAVNSSTEFKSYPLVISEQKNGACYVVTGPALKLGVDPRFEAKARDYAYRLAQEIRFRGVFAIEMFETSSGELLVNEIAPRVHNSGHFTQDACAHDQFEMHLRVLMGGVTGESLPALECTSSFAMLNLLGPEGVKGQFKGLREKLPEPPADCVLHWYGKEDIFPGRKLGHVNSSSGNVESLQSYEQSWIQFLKGLKS